MEETLLPLVSRVGLLDEWLAIPKQSRSICGSVPTSWLVGSDRDCFRLTGNSQVTHMPGKRLSDKWLSVVQVHKTKEFFTSTRNKGVAHRKLLNLFRLQDSVPSACFDRASVVQNDVCPQSIFGFSSCSHVSNRIYM